MLRIDYPNVNQIEMMEIFLKDEVFEMDEELKTIDKILSDERFIQPFIKKFNTRYGRGSFPVNPFIRLMYIKEYYQIGYERLIPEVKRNIMLRRFCRIPLSEKMPDPTTLMKLVKKYGEETIKEINQALIKKAHEEKLIKGKKLRVDTTVTEANIHYPTDVSLLKDSVKNINREVKKGGAKVVKGFKGKMRKIKEKLFEVNKTLKRRSKEAIKEVRKITVEMITITREVILSAERAAKRLKGDSTEKAAIAKKKINSAIDTAKTIVEQTRKVLSGVKSIPGRIISIHDKEARAIKKGKPGNKTEFGYKVQIEEVENGFVSGYNRYIGNPRDDGLLEDALKRHEEMFDKNPDSVAADRGYSTKKNEQILIDRKVKNRAIPKKGRKTEERKIYERKQAIKKLFRWRAGIEGRISCLKRRYGLKRSLLNGESGVGIHVGWGILAHNLDKAVNVMN